MKYTERIQAAYKAFRSGLRNPSEWLYEALLGGRTASGITINPTRAMNISAVYSAVRLASETIMSLPVHAYRKNGKIREIIDHPVASLLNGMANPEMSGIVVREVLQGAVELRGNGFAEIVHDKNGFPVELWPIHPDKIRIQRNSRKELEYVYTPSGDVIPAWKMLHIRGYGSDGIIGYSMITLARESLGLTAAAEEFGARFFGNGTNVGGFLKHDGRLGDTAYKRLKKEMNAKYKGLQKSHGMIILEEGMEFQKIGITPEDSQFLETRKFQVSEVARWFRLPPHLIGDLEKATFSNIEHQGLEAVQYSWIPRVTRWEHEIKAKLLFNPYSDRNIYVKFSLEGLMRGDHKSRAEFYHMAIQDGWMNADEVRALEDLPPQPDGQGEIYYMPMNMFNKKDSVSPSGTGERATVKMIERRTAEKRVDPGKILAARRKLADRYRTKIRDAAGKILKDQGEFVRKAIDEYLEEDEQFFRNFVLSGLDGHKRSVRGTMAPVITSLAFDLYPLAQEELGDEESIPDSYQGFVNEYLDAFTLRHLSRNKNQVRSIIDDPEVETKEALEEMLTEWEERKPERIEKEETTRARSAFIKAAYVALGVSKLRWVTNGKSCPYCNAIDGAVVEIHKNFYNKGDELHPEEAGSRLVFQSNIGHPPAHPGCDCDVVATD